MDATALPPSKLSKKTSDNPVSVLLTFSAACILLASDTEETAQEYVNNGPYTSC